MHSRRISIARLFKRHTTPFAQQCKFRMKTDEKKRKRMLFPEFERPAKDRKWWEARLQIRQISETFPYLFFAL
jgi:hypothetical protein